ncbi:MAG: hypothetical protein ABEJ65_07250 [bacterium]
MVLLATLPPIPRFMSFRQWSITQYTLIVLSILLGWGTTLWLIDRWIKYGHRSLVWVAVVLCTVFGTTLYLFPAVVSQYSLGTKDFLGIVFSLGIGYLISLLFRKPGYIVGILYCCGMIDMLSVSLPGGPTRETAKKAPQVLSWFLQQYPVPFTDRWMGILGFADWILITAIVCIAHRYKLPYRKMLLGVYGGLVLLLVMTLITNASPGLPALPFIALGLLFPVRNRLKKNWWGYRESLAISIGLIGFTFFLIALT